MFNDRMRAIENVLVKRISQYIREGYKNSEIDFKIKRYLNDLISKEPDDDELRKFCEKIKEEFTMSEDFEEYLNKRKPRKNQNVYYYGDPVGKVKRIEGNLCFYEKPDGDVTCFIWKFYNGLNKLHSWK